MSNPRVAVALRVAHPRSVLDDKVYPLVTVWESRAAANNWVASLPPDHRVTYNVSTVTVRKGALRGPRNRTSFGSPTLTTN